MLRGLSDEAREVAPDGMIAESAVLHLVYYVRHPLGGRLSTAVEPIRDLVQIRNARKRHRFGHLPSSTRSRIQIKEVIAPRQK